MATAQDERPDAKVANPMAPFARMVPGEWWVTFLSGTSQFDIWHWGPGRHSMRAETYGSGAVDEPWRELQVVYWHPGRRQVCLLGLHPDIPHIGRGVMEGTMRFEGETADAVFDLYQPGHRREMGLRWTFDGPDKYHETLLESTGPAGLMPLNELEYVRSKEPAATRLRTDEQAPEVSKRLEVFESLLDHTWQAKGDRATGDFFHIQSTFEWVPYVEAIYARVCAPTNDGEPTHLLDAYLFHHVGTDSLRCLALSKWGGVYEGELIALEGGALGIDLKSYEGDQVNAHVVRLDFETDGTLRNRVWSIEGTERTLMLDVRHENLEPKND
jgi:hypothetical protein